MPPNLIGVVLYSAPVWKHLHLLFLYLRRFFFLIYLSVCIYSKSPTDIFPYKMHLGIILNSNMHEITIILGEM